MKRRASGLSQSSAAVSHVTESCWQCLIAAQCAEVQLGQAMCRNNLQRRSCWTCVMALLLLQIEDYERTEDEDEHFGIDHLKAEDAKEQAAGRCRAGMSAAKDGLGKHDTGAEGEVKKTSM